MSYTDLVNEIYELRKQLTQYHLDIDELYKTDNPFDNSKYKNTKYMIEENERLKNQLNELQKPQIFIDTQDMEERYGEGKYQDYLEEQVKELKKELEESKNRYINRLNNQLAEDIEPDEEDFYFAEIENKANAYDKLLKKQKEFIKYLEDEITKLRKVKVSSLEEITGKDYLIKIKKEILTKYKEIIGNDINVGSKGVKNGQ